MPDLAADREGPDTSETGTGPEGAVRDAAASAQGGSTPSLTARRTDGSGLSTANREAAGSSPVPGGDLGVAQKVERYIQSDSCSPSPLPTAIRLAEPADLPFVFSCWVRAVQAARNRAYRELPTDTLRAVERFLRLADTNWVSAAQHALCERLLKRSLVLIACNPGNTDQIYGFLVVEPEVPVVHFLFVKKRFRRLGVAKDLMANAAPGALEAGLPVQVTYRPPHELSSWPLTYRSTHLCEGSNR